MIGKGSPWELKVRLKEGALHFDTNANMLYACEQDQNGNARWIAMGHVVPIEVPRWNKPIDPKLQGNPYGGVRLLGVKD
jgi:hypothetical protein